MLSDARRRETYALLQRHGSASVGEIAAWLHVSAQTVRRDLDRLGQEGLVRRVRGGATVAGGERAAGVGEPDHEPGRRIAARAAALVPAGATIFLGSGSTSAHVVPWLADRPRTTVVTNALDVAREVAALPDVQAIVLGGTLRHDERTLLGATCERQLRELSIDHALLAPHGLDSDGSLYAPSVAEASLLRAVVETARRTTLLAPSSAFARRGPFRMPRPERAGAVVVEASLGAATREALAAAGCEVLAA